MSARAYTFLGAVEGRNFARGPLPTWGCNVCGAVVWDTDLHEPVCPLPVPSSAAEETS